MRKSFLCLLLVLTSCGFQYGSGELAETYSTVTVPFVKGDINGTLTAALIKNLSNSTPFTYEVEGADLILNVEIEEVDGESIGYRYNRKKDGRLKHEIIPTETRLIVFARVEVIDAACSKTILGPVMIGASSDFDHDFYTSRNEINVFSLGQVSDIDAAEDAVRTPLNQKLARKIIDYISNAW